MRDLIEALQHDGWGTHNSAGAHDNAETGVVVAGICSGRPLKAADGQTIAECVQRIAIADHDDRISGLGQLVEPA